MDIETFASQFYFAGRRVRRGRGKGGRTDRSRLRAGHAFPLRRTGAHRGTRIASASECANAGRLHQSRREECRSRYPAAVVGVRRESCPEADQQVAKSAVAAARSQPALRFESVRLPAAPYLAAGAVRRRWKLRPFKLVTRNEKPAAINTPVTYIPL